MKKYIFFYLIVRFIPLSHSSVVIDHKVFEVGSFIGNGAEAKVYNLIEKIEEREKNKDNNHQKEIQYVLKVFNHTDLGQNTIFPYERGNSLFKSILLYYLFPDIFVPTFTDGKHNLLVQERYQGFSIKDWQEKINKKEISLEDLKLQLLQYETFVHKIVFYGVEFVDGISISSNIIYDTNKKSWFFIDTDILSVFNPKTNFSLIGMSRAMPYINILKGLHVPTLAQDTVNETIEKLINKYEDLILSGEGIESLDSFKHFQVILNSGILAQLLVAIKNIPLQKIISSEHNIIIDTTITEFYVDKESDNMNVYLSRANSVYSTIMLNKGDYAICPFVQYKQQDGPFLVYFNKEKISFDVLLHKKELKLKNGDHIKIIATNKVREQIYENVIIDFDFNDKFFDGDFSLQF